MRLRPILACTIIVGLLGSRAADAQDTGSAGSPDDVVTATAGDALPTLQASLATLLEDRLFTTSDIGIQVVDVITGDEVWAFRADEAHVPASVTKVLTAATALRVLGPAWTFNTDVYGDGDVDSDGVLDGDLYVRGGGDPTLVVEQVWKIIRDLQSAGVVEVDGDVVFDDTRFEAPGYLPGWNKAVDEANGPAYFAPLGALSLNYNAASLIVGPGAERGAPAQVDLETPASVIRVENSAVTGPARSRPWLKVERERDPDGGVTFTVSGNVPLDSDNSRVYRAVGDPTLHFMAVFEHLLKERGITVTGKMRRGQTPDSARLLVRHASDPLGIVLARMNKRSSNIMAEQVLRATGMVASDGKGTTAAGLRAMQDYLDTLGIPRDQYNLVNGSGLSRDIRLHPSHVTAVLVDLWHDRRFGPEFQASLALGGVDGTLRRRFGAENAALVRGKTGSLNSVYCLAGYLHAGDGHVYAFSFLVNGFSGSSSKVRALQDRFVQTFLEYTPVGVAGAD